VTPLIFWAFHVGGGHDESESRSVFLSSHDHDSTKRGSANRSEQQLVDGLISVRQFNPSGDWRPRRGLRIEPRCRANHREQVLPGHRLIRIASLAWRRRPHRRRLTGQQRPLIMDRVPCGHAEVLAPMQVHCPKCRRVLGGNAINVATDVARCDRCDEVFELSTLVRAGAAGSVDLDNPPRGAWYQAEFNGFVVGATTRHLMALFLVPFLCVWSGFSLGGIYGSQFVQGKFDLFLSLFGIPFVLGTLLLGSMALMAICGKVVVRVADAEGEVFTGIGPLGWRRLFDAQEIRSVRIEPYVSGRQHSMRIVLDGPHKLRFGSLLTEARRDFIADVLRLELTGGKKLRSSVD
jgi:hypothetical protein